jgi:fido (protein-threonine AMPylation protein)
LPGAFEASAEFDYDALRTAVEIQRSGEDVLRWLRELAGSDEPRAVDIYLVRDIHFRWFETTFPEDAGRERTEMVLNRKGTAVSVDAVLPGVVDACKNWKWRQRFAPSGPEFVEFVVAEANALSVAVYDVHPFIDGNTRATWHLRNYLFMREGLRPLVRLNDPDTYESLWWQASAQDHGELDRVVLQEIAAQDR